MAVLQENQVFHDQCQIESGQFGTFVGVYDGHGGPETARFVCDRIFQRFQEILAENSGSVTIEGITSLFLQMEDEFLKFVELLWDEHSAVATVGTCCLVGVIYQQILFVANYGDSRAILGRKNRNTGGIIPWHLSGDHSAGLPTIRNLLRHLHPEDPNIVSCIDGTWKVKVIIGVSRSIGHVYMKNPVYSTSDIDLECRLRSPINMPYLTAEPAISMHQINPDDSFIIFASGGFWELLTKEEAVKIVHKHQHSGSAKKLIKKALKKAHNMPYEHLCDIDKSSRRNYHNDITVIVLFLNRKLIARGSVLQTPVSIRSALNHK